MLSADRPPAGINACSFYYTTKCGKCPVFFCKAYDTAFRQYRTKIVRQMRRQIFRQMKQKAEWILDIFTSIFVKYESLFRIWRMQIASSDFLRDEGKNGENPLWIFEYFPEISRKICTQDACEKIRNRLWREICKQMACKVARRSLCGIALYLSVPKHAPE